MTDVRILVWSWAVRLWLNQPNGRNTRFVSGAHRWHPDDAITMLANLAVRDMKYLPAILMPAPIDQIRFTPTGKRPQYAQPRTMVSAQALQLSDTVWIRAHHWRSGIPCDINGPIGEGRFMLPCSRWRFIDHVVMADVIIPAKEAADGVDVA